VELYRCVASGARFCKEVDFSDRKVSSDAERRFNLVAADVGGYDDDDLLLLMGVVLLVLLLLLVVSLGRYDGAGPHAMEAYDE
jgi:hypothetical protein